MNPHLIAKTAEVIAVAGTVSGIAFNLLCLWSAASFLKSRTAGKGDSSPQSGQPVSVLKPLKGLDPEMYESFRSFCLQDYPTYEIIFGVSDANDPAIALVERLKAEFFEQEMELIVCEPKPGANVKVVNLAQMAAHARHEYLVISDSDIRVGPDYLKNVVAPLRDAKTGLVTCLYRGVAAPNLGSGLESVGISSDFAPGVLAARTVENGLHFGLGSTLALRRSDLAAIGGFESFADYLADDYELGKRISNIGLRVLLSEEVVETFLPRYSFSEFIQHQLRWSRTVRGSRPWGFGGLIFTFALPWAVLAVLFSGRQSWAWELIWFTLVVRLIVTMAVGRGVLQDKRALRLLWLFPVRDVLAPFLWAASFLGNTIAWRGEHFSLRKGKLTRLDAKSNSGT